MYIAGLAVGISYLVLKAVLNPHDPNALAAGPIAASSLFLPWIGPNVGLYPYNPAAWSLFAELLANLV
ncbi:hypothetical protein LTR94_025052, partial [Friedmanniomyces endolithicus]